LCAESKSDEVVCDRLTPGPWELFVLTEDAPVAGAGKIVPSSRTKKCPEYFVNPRKHRSAIVFTANDKVFAPTLAFLARPIHRRAGIRWRM